MRECVGKRSVFGCNKSHTVLHIDPKLKVSGGPGGKGSAGHLLRLKK